MGQIAIAIRIHKYEGTEANTYEFCYLSSTWD